MEIIHKYITPDTIDTRLFARLYRNNLYHMSGVLQKVYKNPGRFIKNKAYLSYLTEKDRIISVMFISKKQYYGWEHIDEQVADTYGTISFYTKIAHRRKGYATALYQDFDKIVKIRPISASYRSKDILESVSDNNNIIYFGSGFTDEYT